MVCHHSIKDQVLQLVIKEAISKYAEIVKARGSVKELKEATEENDGSDNSVVLQGRDSKERHSKNSSKSNKDVGTQLQVDRISET